MENEEYHFLRGAGTVRVVWIDESLPWMLIQSTDVNVYDAWCLIDAKNYVIEICDNVWKVEYFDYRRVWISILKNYLIYGLL